MPIHPSSARALRFLLGVLGGCAASLLSADPLSKRLEVDFYRQISSRDLHGLATRSDGRLVAGPVLTDLTGTAPAALLWCLEPTADGKWVLGTGPDGRIFEASVDWAKGGFTTREIVRLDDSQVFAVKSVGGGKLLAGTSPKGGLYLVSGGKIQARVGLPVDSIFDLLVLDGKTALVATGNPGRIYRVDLAKFAAAGIIADKITDAGVLASRGLTLFGEIRDRNVRRLARLSDGRVAAGSSPKGNVYVFPNFPPRSAPEEILARRSSRPASEDGASSPAAEQPQLLQENHEAEVTDLLPQPNGDLLAAIVFSASTLESRAVGGPDKPKDNAELPPAAEPEKFGGRGVLVRFPVDGFPEVLTARIGAAFYRLARQGNVVLAAGGEQGGITGYDLDSQYALTFPGSTSARLNGLVPVPGVSGRFLVLRNNSPGLASLDFQAAAPRVAETRAFDLGGPAQLGALRIDRLRDLDERALAVDIRTSNGTDDLEGWSPWSPLASAGDGWRGPPLRGRYVKLRIHLPAAAAASAELDRAALYFLPQNRRPQLQDFHFLSPNYAVVPPPDAPTPVITTINQLLQPKDDDKHKTAFLSSQVVPSPGSQVAFWTVTAPEADNLVCTFSIRREGDPAWTDLAVDSTDSFVQFDTAHLPDGVYFTRLVAREAAPRPLADRLTATFETDNLVVDHTPPVILDASVRRTGGTLAISVHGRDALSLLDSIEVNFNNGAHEVVEQPADGIRDGREETFVLEEPLASAAGATALDITLYDAAGNGATRHLKLETP